MREIIPSLTVELKKHNAGKAAWTAVPYEIRSFRELVKHVARLAYANAEQLLFFRGQDKDYQSKAGGSTLYPSIYREDSLAARELRYRFFQLNRAAGLLVQKFTKAGIEGHKSLRQKQYIQWSILQHYEVVATPLLDVTQSLRVACSVAQQGSTDPTCYVYVLGLPYLTNRITVNSEHDIVIVRLLSICPPDALRPYFQEGYLVGTTDITTDFESKTELDFRNRLIAKFAIPRNKSFWGSGFNEIPRSALYPTGDDIQHLCDQMKTELATNVADFNPEAARDLEPGDLGVFIKEWAELEEFLLNTGRNITERNVSLREAISQLAKTRFVSSNASVKLEALRAFRNAAVHKPESIAPSALDRALKELREVKHVVMKPR
jgi:hypothetical protein